MKTFREFIAEGHLFESSSDITVKKGQEAAAKKALTANNIKSNTKKNSGIISVDSSEEGTAFDILSGLGLTSRGESEEPEGEVSAKDIEKLKPGMKVDIMVNGSRKKKATLDTYELLSLVDGKTGWMVMNVKTEDISGVWYLSHDDESGKTKVYKISK